MNKAPKNVLFVGGGLVCGTTVLSALAALAVPAAGGTFGGSAEGRSYRTEAFLPEARRVFVLTRLWRFTFPEGASAPSGAADAAGPEGVAPAGAGVSGLAVASLAAPPVGAVFEAGAACGPGGLLFALSVAQAGLAAVNAISAVAARMMPSLVNLASLTLP
ncbi:MAG: hypothetical protein JO273_22175 [Methylobacteriaceae bacterium]|nr:hypothetical protein [Methylobacteriaceae bacterium]